MTDILYRTVAPTERTVREQRSGTEREDRVVRVLLWVALGLAAVLGAGLLIQMFGETGGTNSYATVADAFLHGRLDVTSCFDIDCALFDGKNYIVFPPGPAILSMPFVAVFGVSFAGFIAFATVLSGVAVATWWRIFKLLDVERLTASWLTLAIVVGTPLYFVTIRGDGVWFLAQVCAFLFTSLAVWTVLERKSLLMAGAFIGIAFLSRQMTVLVLPFLYVLWLRSDQKLIAFNREQVTAVVKLAAPVVAALALYMLYNYARFGAPLDTGYDYIATLPADATVITARSQDIGLFSGDYFLFNVFYFLFQGFHVEFTGPYLTELGGMDRMGTSLLAASPFVLLLAFAPWARRPVWVGALCALAMILPMLVYHSNGYSQFNVQRYVLDWAPILFVVLALTIRRPLLPAFALLVTYAIGLNVVTSLTAFAGQGA